MKWNEKSKTNIGYRGYPMISNEIGYLKWLVDEQGINHVFKMALCFMDIEYIKETIEVINMSHDFFKDIYSVYSRNVKSNPKIINQYGGMVYIIQEYGYDHLFHVLLLWVDDDIMDFMEKMHGGLEDFRSDRKSLFPVKESYPSYYRGD